MEEVLHRESSLKELLTAPSSQPIQQLTSFKNNVTSQISVTNTSNITSPVSDTTDDASNKLITYLQHLSDSGDKEYDLCLVEHSYSRPWNWRPETSYIRPTKTLFISKNSNNNSILPLEKPHESQNSNDFVDVESVSSPPTPIYNTTRAISLMEECSKHATLSRSSKIDDDVDIEESINRTNWTSTQNRLFTSMIKILNLDRLGRLTYNGHWNEPIIRRAVIDKSVQRVRNLMASIAWDTKLTQWLHNILLDNLNSLYLGAYYDILQTLKPKLPYFVEKMMFAPGSLTRIGYSSNENLFPLFKKAWDPIGPGIFQDKPRKLPGNPIIVVAPCALSISGIHSKYYHKWVKYFSTIAQVVTVSGHLGQLCLRMNMENCADHLFYSTRAKIQEVRNENPNRPIILVGLNTGSAIACHVAQQEHVVAIICLGFSLLTAEGCRGESDDYLLDLSYPILFVIGQNSHRTSREEMEDLRERMKIESGLIVVGSADDYLRINKNKKRNEGLTQSIVDRCILDEIAEFLGSLLLNPYPPISRSTSSLELQFIKNPSSRLRNNSNGSSTELDVQLHTKLLARPGRPPGTSKKKNFVNISSSNHCNSLTSSNETVIKSGNIIQLNKTDVCRGTSTLETVHRAVQNIISSSASATTTSSTFSTPVTLSSTSTLAAALQSGSKPQNKNNSSGSGSIKILENITVTPPISSKIISNGRPLTFLNPMGNGNRVTSVGNVVILPDGTKYIRNSGMQTVRTVGGTSAFLPPLNKSIQRPPTNITGISKMLPTKRSVVNTKPPSPEKRLPSKTELTAADIMDLPIIFADDNTISNISQLETKEQISVNPKKLPVNKIVVVNKQVTAVTTTSSPSISSTTVKRATTQDSNQPVKYAKIVVSKRIPDSKPKLKPNDTFYCDVESELKANILKKVTPLTKKATISIEGKLTNVTLRVPPTVSRNVNNINTINSVSVPSRYIQTESGSGSSFHDPSYVLNRRHNSIHLSKLEKPVSKDSFNF